MVGPVHVHALTVSDLHAREFFVAVENTLRTMTSLQLHQIYYCNRPYHAINFSFNHAYIPFFGFTAGFTPEEDRVYMPEDVWLLNKIGNYLDGLNLGIPGGRVSISSARVIKRLDDNSVIDLCVFTWQGEDVWSKCNQLLNNARARAAQQ